MHISKALFWMTCTSCVLLILLKLGNVCFEDGLEEGFNDTMDRTSVTEYQQLLTPDDCASLIEFAASKGMTVSEVNDNKMIGGTGVDYSHRKSKQVWIKVHEHPVAKKLASLSVRLTGYPESNQEQLQVAMYEEGGEFKAHHDACANPDPDFCERTMNHGAGPRRTTLLVYLNEGFTGGETHFVKKGTSITPTTGKAILFWNTNEDNSLIDETMHQGMPVVKGHKWIATIWSHPKPYPS